MKQSKNKSTNEPIINFTHNYYFIVTNLIKITFIRMENFRANMGRRPGSEHSIVWGRYNLLINYQIYQGKKEMSRSKEFSRGFSFALNDSLLQVEEIDGMEENLRCEYSFNHGVSPISFGLFPLLSKINYIPFKIDVTVHGSIVNVPLDIDPEMQEERLEEEVFDESFISPGQSMKEIKNEPDLISLEEKRRAPVPFPNPQYYKTHQLYYDYFFHNLSPKKKKTSNSRK